MQRIVAILVLVLSCYGCYPIKTSTNYKEELSFIESRSKPIYLSFRDSQNTPFYFMLSRDSNSDNIKIIVRWKNPAKRRLLFDGFNSAIKFLVNRQEIFSFQPAYKTKIIGYNFNTGGMIEEALFEVPAPIFRKIAEAKSVTVELNGKRKTVIGEFNRWNTKKAFLDFYKNSY